MVMESERAAGEGETEEGEMHSVSRGSKEKGPASYSGARHHPVQTLPAEDCCQPGDSKGSRALLTVWKKWGPTALPSFLYPQGAPRTCRGGGYQGAWISGLSQLVG